MIPRNMSVLAYAGGFTLWAYKLTGVETLAEARASGFFNDWADMFALGDLVIITSPAGAGVSVVASMSPAGVILGALS